jgi:hypothetical protein
MSEEISVTMAGKIDLDRLAALLAAEGCTAVVVRRSPVNFLGLELFSISLEYLSESLMTRGYFCDDDAGRASDYIGEGAHTHLVLNTGHNAETLLRKVAQNWGGYIFFDDGERGEYISQRADKVRQIQSRVGFVCSLVSWRSLVEILIRNRK